MNKISTQSITLLSSARKNATQQPTNETLAKIKQFARAYSFASTANRSLGNLVLN